jgi:flagellar hook-associated protein 1 FlgK
MQTTFSGFEAARQALVASQTALDITSQNIANASTPGYTRQRIVLTSASNTGSDKYMVNQPSVGQGVTVSSIQQVRDNFLDVRYRSENSSKSMWDNLSNSLSQVEDVFNEFSSGDSLTGLSGQFSTLLSNFKQLQTTPDDNNMNAVIKNSVDSICQTVKSDNSQLSGLLTQIKGDLQITIDGSSGAGSSGAAGINATLENISSLNQQIAVYEVSGQSANELRDQRNMLLDQLSGKADLNVTTQNNGMVTVALKNDNTHMLINADNVVSKLSLSADQTTVQWQDDSTTVIVSGGQISASLQMINGDGTNSGANGDLGIPAMKSKLDAFVTGFVTTMNSIDTTPGQELLQGTDASNVALSAAWKINTALIKQNCPNLDTAAYAGQFINALNQNSTVTYNGNAYPGTLQDYTDGISMDVANRLSYVKQMSSSSDSIVKNLDQQRQSVSSVSIDEEGINIIKYQQSYNAAAKVITVMSEMLDTLLKSF